MTLKVLHVCDEVGLGGTERGIVAMCRTMRYDTFLHEVLCLRAPGVRAAHLDGIAPIRVRASIPNLPSYFESSRFDVVIVHRAGAEHARWNEILRSCRQSQCPVVVEANIFGQLDAGAEDEVFDLHLHISKASYCKFREQAEARSYSRLARHRVLYIPSEVRSKTSHGPASAAALTAREQFGLRANDFVLLRTGRPDVRKWGDLLLDALPLISQRIPAARFVFLSAPHGRARYMARQPYSPRVLVLPATNEDSVLASAYGAADVYFHSSRRGESFGVSLVEAMAAALPVVVNSTPGRDNAQIEVVDHMRTGIIANSPRAFAGAITYLHDNPELRREMGRRGLEKAVAMYDTHIVCRSLAGLVGQILKQKGRNLPDCPELHSAALPGMDEIERYWNIERQEREGLAWESIAPGRTPGFLRHPGWAFLDACDVFARKVGILRHG